MATKLFQKNDELNVVISFTNKLTGVLADPTAVIVKVKFPDATSTTYTYGVFAGLTRLSTGVYRFLLTLSQTGKHYIRSEGSGALIGASPEQSFDVDTTQF